ncbi:magnesium transporter [Baekduia soli]|uniref:Magnesium transporter n=1 Tax=Baekduia soli TaxID=496014 RepID=A0A5B8UA15_9ACTN|nr:CBS domain-containing protein [Baekduia soli]QEC49885.1 magnesium transporter [Baekduia soli]
MPAATAPVLHLSLVVGSALVDADGDRLGRVEDLIVRLGDAGYPPITGLMVSVAGRLSYVAAEAVADIADGAVTLRTAKLDLGRFERRPEEVLLKEDVLDHQLINVDGARLVRANEIELARVEGWWRVVGVDVGPRGGLRRLLPRPVGRHVAPGGFLDWASVEPFVGHVPSVRLRVPHPKLARLHPAQIADLVEAASHHEGEEIMLAVGAGDSELEADVFEELDEQHQREFLQERSDADVAAVLARMAPDDAADVVAELDDDRREGVLALLPASPRTKIRTLLGFDRAQAGGLMSTEFICVYHQATTAEVLDRVRRGDVADDLLTSVFVMDTHRRLEGSVPVTALVRADGDVPVAQLLRPGTPHLVADADLEEVARLMADFNLTSVAVVDDREQMIGVITVDDVLKTLLPKGWRRRFGLLGDE